MTNDISQVALKGYGLFRNVIPKDLIQQTREYLEGELEACLARVGPETGIQAFDSWVTGIDRLLETGSLEQLSHEVRNILCGHFRLETRLGERLKQVGQCPQILQLVRQLLGPGPLGLHMPPAARFVLPGNHYAGVPAHQDISYNRHLGNFLTVWVPMVPIDEECGGVTFFEGARPPIPESDPASDKFWLSPVAVEGLLPVATQLGPGDCLILDPWVIHQSSPNRSKRIRISVDFRFFQIQGPTEKHYLDLETGKVIAPQGA